MSTIGERIKNRRLELGYTQEELSKKLGYKNRSSVNQMENSTELPLKKVTKLANALNVSPSYIMGWDVSINQSNNSGSISNNIGSEDSSSYRDSTSTTNNYYGGCKPCDEVKENNHRYLPTQNRDLFFTVIDYARNMTDEQLLDMVKYAEFILNK